jgi:hypothetical protein
MTEIVPWTPTPFSEGTDLLPQGPQKVDNRGREHIQSEDLVLPVLSLTTGTSKAMSLDGAKLGLFYHSGAQQFIQPPIRVIFCSHWKSRALWPDPNDPDTRDLEICRSRDAVLGTTYGVCNDCGFKEWRDPPRLPGKPKGKSLRPICSLSYCFLALTDLGPAIMRFSRSSTPSAKDYITAWKTSPYPLWAFPTIISVRQETRESGGKKQPYFVMTPRWERKVAIPPHLQAIAGQLFESTQKSITNAKPIGDDDDSGYTDP